MGLQRHWQLSAIGRGLLICRAERDARLFRVAPEDQQYVADALDTVSLGLFANGVDHSGTRLAIRSIDADFDQLVIGQGLFDLGQYGFGEAGIADNDNGTERMAEAAQMAFLTFVELHV